MLPFISQGLTLGISAGAIPGPMHTFMLNETLVNGIRRSGLIAFVPILSDLPLVPILVFLLDQLPAEALVAVRVAGACFLTYLAWGTYQQSKAPLIFATATGTGINRMTIGRGVLINWLNPAPYIFWTTILGPILLDALEQSVWHGAAFVAAFYLPLCGMLLMTGLFVNQLRRLDDSVLRWIMRGSALLLVFFAGWVLVSA